MTEAVAPVVNSYDGPSLLPVGNNPFNVQGYVYFVRRVLPSVRARCPDFVLRVTGPCCHRLSPVEGVDLAGFVPDLAAALARARFLVCPVFGGTGQQIKIIEAMAHGVPVVALEAAAQSSPMRHGVNGLVARDAEEFAEHVCRLWTDRALCRQLGAAARETVARECSRERLVEQLSQLLLRKGPVNRPT
jgi:glycosyltransferase involved in cell wall biosynthesis